MGPRLRGDDGEDCHDRPRFHRGARYRGRRALLRSAARDARDEPSCANGRTRRSATARNIPSSGSTAAPIWRRSPPIAARMSACARASPRRGRCLSRRGARRRRHLRRRARLSRAISRELLRRLHPRSGRQPHRGGDVRRPEPNATAGRRPPPSSSWPSSGTASAAFCSIGRMSSTLSATRRSKLRSPRMNSSVFMCSSSAQSGSQKPLILASSTGLLVTAELHPGQLLDQSPRACRRRPAARRRRPPTRTSCVCARACRG